MRRRLASLVFLACLLANLALFLSATDFPTKDPIHRVDAALIARCRANPGLHLALAGDYELAVELELRDDATNRKVYKTRVDLREPRAEFAIHIQLKGEAGAIHADRWNPRAGLVPLLIHGSLDVPVIPLSLVMLLSALLALRGGSSSPEPGDEPEGDG